MSILTPTIVPTGGAVSLNIAASGTMTLGRAVSGSSGLSAFTQLYSGASIPFFLDVGDQLPAPLDPSTLYVYRLTDLNGTLTSSAIQPAIQLNVQQEALTFILIRLLQAGINSLVLAAGVKRARVLQAMPIDGMPALPLVTVNLDMEQQAEIPIGQSVMQQYSNTDTFTITGFVHRVYRVSILSLDGSERDFYRESLIGIFESIYAGVLQPIGVDVRHRWQAASGQIARDVIGKGPGFYYADVMMEFDGTFNIAITPQYGLIAQIDTTFTGASGSTTETVVPIVSGL